MCALVCNVGQGYGGGVLTASSGSSCAFLGSGAGASSERFIELELGWDDIGRESEGEGEENAARH